MRPLLITAVLLKICNGDHLVTKEGFHRTPNKKSSDHPSDWSHFNLQVKNSGVTPDILHNVVAL